MKCCEADGGIFSADKKKKKKKYSANLQINLCGAWGLQVVFKKVM